MARTAIPVVGGNRKAPRDSRAIGGFLRLFGDDQLQLGILSAGHRSKQLQANRRTTHAMPPLCRRQMHETVREGKEAQKERQEEKEEGVGSLAPDDQRGLLNGRPSILGRPLGPVLSGCHLFQLPPKCIEISDSSFWRTLGHRWGLRSQWGQGIEIGTNRWPSLIESRRTARFRRLLQFPRNSTPLETQHPPPVPSADRVDRGYCGSSFAASRTISSRMSPRREPGVVPGPRYSVSTSFGNGN